MDLEDINLSERYVREGLILYVGDTEKILVVVRSRVYGVEETGKRGQNVQTSNYKINKSRGCNVQHDNHSE